MAKHPLRNRILSIVTAVVLMANMTSTALAAEPLGGANSSTLAREPQLTPAQIGDGSIAGLQFPDPTQGLALVAAPAAGNDGGAHLSYSLLIPKGRGITPDLTLTYDSGGGNGWLGQGWDLSVGEISVDTRWGAPYFDPAFESETYAIDGEMLIPNALGAAWEPRLEGDRQDYTRQVETQYQQIIRHEVPGQGPKGYFWEVHDKGGNVFWYGGKPDQGGPDGYGKLPDTPARPLEPQIDRSAIITDENGNGVRWLLSAQRDVGVNQISYHYTTLQYQYGASGWTNVSSCTPSDTVLCARHTYLTSINYTEAAEIAPAPDGDAEYEVVLTRDSIRTDPVVDAMGGYIDLTADRLTRIAVNYGAPVITGTDSAGNETRAPRNYNQLTVRYDLNYGDAGVFGKSLLRSVTQVGRDGVTSAAHSFTYYDRVSTAGGGYDGFATPVDWNTGSDLPDRQDLSPDVAIGALGSSESNSGEGHAYIGFNPIDPEKIGSFGGSIQIGGGATEAIAEWLDINGDGLPDKVYRDSNGNTDGVNVTAAAADANDTARDGPIRYRLNTSKPTDAANFAPTFGPERTVTGITTLSKEGNFGLEGAFEAFPGITVAVGLGFEVSWGDAYFTDANGDGLPDYVSGGVVWFNHLDANGDPKFVAGDSSDTPVPILDASASVALPQKVTDVQSKLEAANPLVDTVRRWTAPFKGTISINAPVTLAPIDVKGKSVDGVRVAIQQDGNEMVAANLLTTGSQAFTAPLTVAVEAGSNIYFRVGSVNNGANDDVAWSPTITYTKIDGVADDDVPNLPADVNGLSQIIYSAQDDFTLSGRPDTLVFMPFKGTVRFSATVDKLATSDDLRVVLTHNGVAAVLATLPAASVGQTVVTADVAVAAPVPPPDDKSPGSQDSLTVKLVSDSPVDLHAVRWNPSIAYTQAFEKGGVTQKDLAAHPLIFNMTPEVEQYPHSSPAAVSTPWTTGQATTRDAHLTFATDPAGSPAGTAVVTVKTRTGVVARAVVNLPGSVLGLPVSVDADLNAALEANTDYWFDVSIRDAALSDKVHTLTGFTLTDGTPSHDIDVPAGLHWTGRQGIFPLAYRGWAVAGYNAAPTAAQPNRPNQALLENDFVIHIDQNNQPTAPANPDWGSIGSSDPSKDTAYAYLPTVQPVSLPGQPPAVTTPAWVGSRANLAASAAVMRSSRLGSDSITLAADASTAGGGRAVTRVSLTVPSVKLAVGLDPASFSFAFSPSFGLVDYVDMNGDGFPDVITPGSVTYTTQRGAYRPSAVNPGDLAVTNQDLTFSVGAGFSSGLVDIKANSQGKTNATKGGAAGKGGDAEDSGGGISLAPSVDVSWTSPNASEGSDGAANPSASYSGQLDKIHSSDDIEGLPADTAPIQLGLADVNGDGLPDRVYTTPQGVFAHYNLGYRFAAAPVKLSTGGFESQESYAGGLSLGFTTPWADFSGGVSLNWNVDLSRYSWSDVNGDGILDQIHKIDGQAPTVRFGTGSGMLAAKPYGNMPVANVEGINAGQQVSLDRANGIGGQFDFEIGVGPLCLVACYLIINPGASYQNSVSTTEIDLQDVNGDGYADSLLTLDDSKLTVGINKQADTNLLAAVSNPLGGTMKLTYARAGNTVDNPDSVWTLASLEVNDGRPGDGVDVRRTTFAYAGLKFDRLQRTSLGFKTVTETELNELGASVRATVHTYLNDNVFNSGLETSTKVNDAATGDYLHGVLQTWNLRDVRGTAVMNSLNTAAALGYSIAPQLTSIVQQVGNGGAAVGQQSTTLLVYDDLGDVIHQEDLGEDDDPTDNVIADYVFSRQSNGSSGIGSAGDLPHNRPSPIWNAGLCPTWVSLPVAITVSNGSGQVYRHRDGRSSICDNASVTHLEEFYGAGPNDHADTELTYDAWGSYDRIVYPVGQNGRRYSVQYVWDTDGHANIADVTEYDLDPNALVICDDHDPKTVDEPATAVDHFLGAGLCSLDTFTQGLRSTALFDPLTNLVASRTDANGNTVRTTYDALGRLASVSSPVASDPQPLVRYEYFLPTPAAPTASAVAHHFDVFHPGDPINTAAFVDGTGRVVQTQQDASLFTAAGQPALTGVIVSGTTIFDAFGRPVVQYNPTRSTKPFGVYEDAAPADLVNDPHTTTVYDLWDMPNTITEPGSRVTTIAYEYGQVGASGPTLYRTTQTAPNNRKTVTYTDMRDVVRAIDDVPVGAASQLTRYQSDGMGQLLKVIDPTGYETRHTYDLLGRRTSTTTPDGGLVTFTYDPDGQLTSRTTANLRANGQQIGYAYNLHRLIRIDYPGTADDVTYTYGEMGAADNGAGQVIGLEDGARIERNVYDPAGNIVQQTLTMKLHAWTPTADQSKFTWTTRWQYDGLGRLKSMVYPDSERLAYGYDAGGLVNAISGEEDGFITVLVGTDPNTGLPIYQNQPHLWTYKYLNDRQYDEFLRRRYDVDGNGVTTELSFDPNTQWLTRLKSTSPNRDTKNQGAAYQQIQNLSYSYDSVGNPLTYRNDVPPAVTNLFSGPTKESYTYDPYERVVAASGEFQLAPDKLQHFSESLSFDARGNVTAKNQLDQIRSNKKELTQTVTTYSYSRTFNQPAPHQISKAGTDSYNYDKDGNLLSINDSKGKLVRGMTWDANDRMRNISDAYGSTDFTYDDSGQRAIERGPSGETATLSPWATVRNTTDIYKYIWAGNDRISIQRDNGGNQELQQYFLHKDLQGSTNIVTDVLGNTFQHQEYFPGGEVWIAEKSTIFRTPYQFGGSYVDEVRAMDNFGDRWYDPIRELMYSPDPVLTNDPLAIVGAPALRAAYAYAGSNPLTNVDPTGQEFTKAQARAFIKANPEAYRDLLSRNPALRASVAKNLKTSLPRSFVRLGLDVEPAKLHQEKFMAIAELAKPFVEINITSGSVKLSPGFYTQVTVRKGTADSAAPQTAAGSSANAANASGGPSVSSAASANPSANTAAPTGNPGKSGPGATAPVKKAHNSQAPQAGSKSPGSK